MELFLVYVVAPTEREPKVFTIESSYAVEANNAKEARELVEAYEPPPVGTEILLQPVKETTKEAVVKHAAKPA